MQLGYGYRLGVDLPSESRGFIPNAKFYDKVYGESHWSANTIISVSIGQGEVLATPLQNGQCMRHHSQPRAFHHPPCGQSDRRHSDACGAA